MEEENRRLTRFADEIAINDQEDEALHAAFYRAKRDARIQAALSGKLIELDQFSTQRRSVA